MPIYEYQCASCGERFEILCNHSERHERAVCPACGGTDVEPVLGGFQVGISRSRLNPGVFERKKGQKPEYKPPKEG